MRSLLIACLIACGGSKAPPPAPVTPPPPPPPADAAPVASARVQEAIARMTGFADRICACKDAPCVQKASDEMAKWGEAETKKGDPAPSEITDDASKQLSEIGDRMGKCIQALQK